MKIRPCAHMGCLQVWWYNTGHDCTEYAYIQVRLALRAGAKGRCLCDTACHACPWASSRPIGPASPAHRILHMLSLSHVLHACKC